MACSTLDLSLARSLPHLSFPTAACSRSRLSPEVEAVFLQVRLNFYLFVTIFESLSFFSSFLLVLMWTVEVQARPGRMTQRMTQKKQRKAKKSKELIRQENLINVFMA
jgi:hypothetical protein